MRKLFFLLTVIIIGYFIVTGQKSPDALQLSSGFFNPELISYAPLPIETDHFNPNTLTRTLKTPKEVLIINPNFRALPRSNSHQCEVMICRHPHNPLIMLANSITINHAGANLFKNLGT